MVYTAENFETLKISLEEASKIVTVSYLFSCFIQSLFKALKNSSVVVECNKRSKVS